MFENNSGDSLAVNTSVSLTVNSEDPNISKILPLMDLSLRIQEERMQRYWASPKKNAVEAERAPPLNTSEAEGFSPKKNAVQPK